MMSRGTFITLEGIDGCGKTTQAVRLAAALEASGREVVRLREPGGTAIGEQIRAILLDPANDEMSSTCELLLYEAARSQLVAQVVEPALARGAVVVCDRFYDSTFAYQAVARGLDEDVVRHANALGSRGVSPDLTILLDLDVSRALARATRDGADRMEAEGVRFQERVRQGYRQLAREEPRRVRVVDGAGTPDQVEASIDALVEAVFSGLLPSTRDAAGAASRAGACHV